jgi:hypothetical protein
VWLRRRGKKLGRIRSAFGTLLTFGGRASRVINTETDVYPNIGRDTAILSSTWGTTLPALSRLAGDPSSPGIKNPRLRLAGFRIARSAGRVEVEVRIPAHAFRVLAPCTLMVEGAGTG